MFSALLTRHVFRGESGYDASYFLLFNLALFYQGECLLTRPVFVKGVSIGLRGGGEEGAGGFYGLFRFFEPEPAPFPAGAGFGGFFAPQAGGALRQKISRKQARRMLSFLSSEIIKRPCADGVAGHFRLKISARFPVLFAAPRPPAKKSLDRKTGLRLF